jgi:hypothetical protein
LQARTNKAGFIPALFVFAVLKRQLARKAGNTGIFSEYVV